MRLRAFSSFLIVWSLELSSSRAALAQTSGANATHDPSRIIESSGKFYFCSTGGSCASSSDGLAWSTTGLKLTVPAWSTKYAPTGNAGIWAPDIVYFKNRYYIYYSFCASVPQAPCVIGLYTTPTLDSTASGYKLTDEGMVVNNPTNDATYQFATIDPGPIVDPSGNLWTSWGSGYGKDQKVTQLWITRLDTTGLPLTSDSAYKPPAVLGHALETGRREGSYVHYRNGYYYLFWNEGGCCAGTASTYTIWVARSQGSITGPYSGNRIFYAGGGNVHGPGHIGIYNACGAERFTYHYYPTATSILGENELTWSSDGWPVPGAMSTTPLKPCDTMGMGGHGGQGGTAGEKGGAGGAAGKTGGGGRGGGGAMGPGGVGGLGEQTGGAGGVGEQPGGAGGVGEQPGGAGGHGIGGAGGVGGATSTGGSDGTASAASGGSTTPTQDAGAGGADDPGAASTAAAGCGACGVAGLGSAADVGALLLLLGVMIAALRQRARKR